jgi:sulfate transport system substrate-binding protein
VSILAEPPVAWVDQVVRRHGTELLARAYLEHLYSEEAQELAAKHFLRPRLTAVLERHHKQFVRLELFTVDEMFGGWQSAHRRHFTDEGTFDRLYQAGRLTR